MRRLLLALAAVAAAAPPAAADTPFMAPLQLYVGGRAIDEGRQGIRFGWPGVYVEGRFRGTGLDLQFEAPADHLRLLVDGVEKAVFRGPGRVVFTLDGLPDGEHVVRLEKMTESQTGGTQLFLIQPFVGGEALPPPPRSGRQIEYIGDSYTVGYGNTSPRRECSGAEVHATTDTQQAFGPLVARHFNADYRIFAYSGFGIVRNYAGNSPGLSLPAIYDRVKPDTAGRRAADPGWRPQLVVVNLGTNDFSTPLRPGEPWSSEPALRSAYRAGYAAFMRRLDARHPRARFVLMAGDTFLADVRQVAAALPPPLRARVTTIRFGDLDLTGCNWHPSLADNRRLAAQLVATIDALPGVWPAR